MDWIEEVDEGDSLDRDAMPSVTLLGEVWGAVAF